MRASWLVALVALVPLAGDAKPHKSHPAPVTPAIDPHVALAEQVAAEQATLDVTRATVATKLSAADATRRHRVLAALRAIGAPQTADPFDAARRRAAARWLLARAADERGLLADELADLDRAQHELAGAAAAVRGVELPAELGWPAHGTIARHFGDYQHERSKATLSRRGLDLEVDDHAPALAAADGVVRFAGSIRGLDHGVIVDCGGYFTVIAKLGEVVVPVGARVARGDRLGRALRHRIYFEVRAKVGPGGLPIDPEPLLR